MRPLVFSSLLFASSSAVWESIACLSGMNRELGPWLRITAPRAASGAKLAGERFEDVPINEALHPSWVLAFGVLPIDRHTFHFTRIDRARGFVERSSSWLEKRWEHRRTLEARAENECLLLDMVCAEPRVGLARPLVERVVAATFQHRHRALRARFGGRDA